ncbi:MAG TPA: ribonuclease H [Polyangia bacterium]|nr:ribonuclease H [Polyangia bacterium]
MDVLYKKGGKVYRAAARNLEPDPEGETWSEQEAAPGTESRPATVLSGGAPGAAAGAAAAETGASPFGDNPFLIWADGACTGNPGPAGIGIVMLDGPRREECSEYLGSGTNNIAELTAIIRALEMAPRDRTVVIHSDSAYALGLLGKNWKAKANQALVERMRSLASEFTDLRLVKVAGHAGIPENERADALAREAVVSRNSRTSSGSELKTSTRPPDPPLPRPPRKLDPLF